MNVGGRNRRGALLSMSALIVVRIASATGAAAEPPSIEAAVERSVAPFSVGPKGLPALGKVEGGPMLDTVNGPPAATHSPGLGPFARLARGRMSLRGSSSPAPQRKTPRRRSKRRLLGPFPTRSASPVPAAQPTAIAAAATRMHRRAPSANPLGDGDWRAARAAIGAFYAARGFEPVWVGASGLTRAGRAVFAQLQRAGDDGLTSRASLCRSRSRPTSAGRARAMPRWRSPSLESPTPNRPAVPGSRLRASRA